MSELPVLYSFRRCPYAMRARLAIAASGQQCELREVVLRDKPAALLQASPKGTVPVLVLPDGAVLEQSLDIMHWALARNDPQHWLDADPAQARAMQALVAECDGAFKQALDRTKYPQRYPSEDPTPHRQRAEDWLVGLEQRLATGGFLFGPRPAGPTWPSCPSCGSTRASTPNAGRPCPGRICSAGWPSGRLRPCSPR
ncbi:glutathione S-transferase N-terminal domain-containing protein [Paenacidovorax monticola]|uniref:glutathione S-transferase N-terminal domain-containing protein n=1 Tax=Paenacidovorax monticola TaxID=1926868 RepID=UPI00336A8957